MKNSVKIIIGIALLVFVTGVVIICVQQRYVHRSIRGIREITHMNRPPMDFRRARIMGHDVYAPGMRGMRPGMGRGQMNRMSPADTAGRAGMRGMRPGQGFGMGPAAGPGMRGMGPGPMGRMGQGPMGRMGQGPMGQGRLLQNIPNLTEKQKKEIADLRQKQQDEMKKFRDEMGTKMQSLREVHRKKVLDLLTPEQKKFVESGTVNPNSGPSK